MPNRSVGCPGPGGAVARVEPGPGRGETMGGRQDLGTVLTNTADGVFAVNPRGRVVVCNRGAERILGYSAEEVLGRPCWEVFGGRDTAGNRLCYPGCPTMTLARGGEPVQHFDMATHTKAGKPIWIDVSTLVIPGAARPASIVHFFRDVTIARELERLIRERLAERRLPLLGDEAALAPLTRRELEILRLMAQGAGTKTLAERLHISSATVRNHVQNMLGKLGVHSRLQAVAYAMSHGLVATAGLQRPHRPISGDSRSIAREN